MARNEPTTRPRRKLLPHFVLGGLILAGTLAFIAFPMVTRSRGKGSHRIEAINNLHQIGLALFEFDSEYGSFPSADTIADVREETGTDLELGDASSNQLFRQLIATGLKSEKPYFCYRPPPARRPDDVVTKGKALEPGECSWGYVAGLNSNFAPGTPIVFGPLVPGTRRFDPIPLRGKAIILSADNSAAPERSTRKPAKSWRTAWTSSIPANLGGAARHRTSSYPSRKNCQPHCQRRSRPGDLQATRARSPVASG